jgi:hypothetical protein
MSRGRKGANSSSSSLEFQDNGYYENDDFDGFYSDDVIDDEYQKSGSSKAKWFIPLAVVLTGATLTANINLNGGAVTEFGQGVVGVGNSCASNLQLSPVTSFYQQTDGLTIDRSRFLLEAIDVSGIPDSCIGSDFILRVYDNVNAAPLTVTDSSNDGSVRLDFVRFSMLPGRDFRIVGDVNAYMEILDTSTALSEVAVVFDAGGLEGDIGDYADPRNVYTITIESVPGTPVPSASATSSPA